METGPAKNHRNGSGLGASDTKSPASDTGQPSKTHHAVRRLASDNEINLKENEELEDVATELQPDAVEPKVDVNTLKNEILTDGMEVSQILLAILL